MLFRDTLQLPKIMKIQKINKIAKQEQRDLKKSKEPWSTVLQHGLINVGRSRWHPIISFHLPLSNILFAYTHTWMRIWNVWETSWRWKRSRSGVMIHDDVFIRTRWWVMKACTLTLYEKKFRYCDWSVRSILTLNKELMVDKSEVFVLKNSWFEVWHWTLLSEAAHRRWQVSNRIRISIQI